MERGRECGRGSEERELFFRLKHETDTHTHAANKSVFGRKHERKRAIVNVAFMKKKKE